jgi:hypothetical protein
MKSSMSGESTMKAGSNAKASKGGAH